MKYFLLSLFTAMSLPFAAFATDCSVVNHICSKVDATYTFASIVWCDHDLSATEAGNMDNLTRTECYDLLKASLMGGALKLLA